MPDKSFETLCRIEVLKTNAVNGRTINLMCFAVLFAMAFVSPVYRAFTVAPILSLCFAYMAGTLEQVFPRFAVYASVLCIISTIVSIIAVFRIFLGV